MLKQVFVLLAIGFLPVEAIKWSNCGGEAPVQILTLSVKPDNPIIVRKGANLTVGGMFVVTGDAGTRFNIHVTLEKKVLFWWVKIPCTSNDGSCTYNGVKCEDIKQLLANPTSCPLVPNLYIVKMKTFTLPQINIPSFIINGEYKQRVDIRDEDNNKRIACIEIYAKLHT